MQEEGGGETEKQAIKFHLTSKLSISSLGLLEKKIIKNGGHVGICLGS